MGHRVLVVDDEDGLRTTLAANLELDGFEVVEADSGAAALARASEQEFDVVISDVRMPGMSGVDLFRRLRELRPGVPVLLMTAFTVEHVIRQALREGVHMVVPKPFDPERVGRQLRRAVDRPLVCVIGKGAVAMVGALSLPVRVAADEAEASALVEGGQVGVCIIDLATADAPRLIGRLRALDPGLGFIVLSGHGADHLLGPAAQHAPEILRKPVPPQDLVEAIARARGRV
jgi:DNA-binding NtrC family response regulator